MKQRLVWILAGITSVLTLVLIYMIKAVDVAYWKESDVMIGFSKLNIGFHKLTGMNPFCYRISQALGLIALALVAGSAVLGLIEWIKRKKLSSVDQELFALGGLYVILGGLYVFFEKAAISYRPIIEEGASEAEASFPSSHTMLACVVFVGWILVLSSFLRRGLFANQKNLFLFLQFLLAALTVLMVFTRLFSGVHWFTDICGAVLISATLLLVFAGVLKRLQTDFGGRDSKEDSE